MQQIQFSKEKYLIISNFLLFLQLILQRKDETYNQRYPSIWEEKVTFKKEREREQTRKPGAGQ